MPTKPALSPMQLRRALQTYAISASGIAGPDALFAGGVVGDGGDALGVEAAAGEEVEMGALAQTMPMFTSGRRQPTLEVVALKVRVPRSARYFLAFDGCQVGNGYWD